MSDVITGPEGITTAGEDMSAYPVLIIPGYGSPGYHSTWVGKHIQSRGLNTVNLKLPWLAVGDMERSAEMVAEHVEHIQDRHGFEKVNLFGYSLGGLIARYYLQELEGHQHLGRAAFLAPPMSGAYLGYLGYFTPAGRQVRPGSSFLNRLESHPVRYWGSDRCLSIYARWDGVIVPGESASLPSGYNLRLSRPISHWGVVLNKRLIHCATGFLKGSLPEGAEPGRDLKMKSAPVMYTFSPQTPATGLGKVWGIVLGSFRSLARRGKSILGRHGY